MCGNAGYQENFARNPAVTVQGQLAHVYRSASNHSERNVLKPFSAAIALLIVGTGAALADCKEDVDGAFEKLRHSTSFRMRTTIVNEQGSLSMTVDYVLPDRMHQRIMTTGAEGVLELIVVGTKAWSTNGRGWAELPPEYAERVSTELKTTVAEAPTQKTRFICLGDKELEGKTYAAYRAWIPVTPDADMTRDGPRNVQTVYIDKVTGLPERNIVTADKFDDKRLFDGTFSFPPAITIDPPETSATP